ncbi:binding-protein-dependent transport system inner membrane component [Brucella suis bv. 5 str. 513]|nr:binding-protein-dependent transport system inner membrane component [Brucella suis bv. 5 str. 513]
MAGNSGYIPQSDYCGADCISGASSAPPASSHDCSGNTGHTWHGSGCRGVAQLSGATRWFSRTLMLFGLVDAPLKLTNNYWGVFASLIITGFPFTFLLTLSYVSGIDPALEQAAATHGAKSWQRFRYVLLPLLIPGLAITFCLSFVLAFAVFPSAILLGAPAGPTRVISIAAYQAAFEQYDYSMAAAIAMIMAAVQLAIVVLVLGIRSLFYRGATSGGKG